MELSVKEIGGIAGWCLSLGGVVTWVKIKIKDNGDNLSKYSARLKKIEDDNARLAKLEDHDTRLTKVEKKFVTENGEPALLSYRAHNHICDGKVQYITQELKHVLLAMNNNITATKEHSEQVSLLAIAVAVLEEKLERK